ncbi:MAG: hypothetical protein WD845_04075 [Pirellulales bacterium]
MSRLRAGLFGLLVALCWAPLSMAADFRIETKVFVGKDSEPVSHNETLFQAGYVYDYLSEPQRITVFDQVHGRFVLLDPTRKLKVEIKTDDVVVFSDRFHTWAAKSSNGFMKFAADPEFEVKLSSDGKLTMVSPHLTYELETVPAESEQSAQQYREFSDWYARFNAMIHLGSTPPFPRLAVNKELAKNGLIPTQVTLTIPAQRTLGVSAVTMRSEHHVARRLLPRDIEKIGETANQLATFKSVDLAEFEPDAISKR